MGKHRSKEEKLLALQERLRNSDSIANREIRAILSPDEYADYELWVENLSAVDEENILAAKPIRSPDQQAAAQAIKMLRSLVTRTWNRIATDNSIENWREIARERLEALSNTERADLNCWEWDNGNVVLTHDAEDSAVAIYVNLGTKKRPAKDIKREALLRVVDDLLADKNLQK